MKDENFMSQSEVGLCYNFLVKIVLSLSLSRSLSQLFNGVIPFHWRFFHSNSAPIKVQALVSTVHDILEFQAKFLKEIERPVETETGFEEFSAVEQFQVS